MLGVTATVGGAVGKAEISLRALTVASATAGAVRGGINHAAEGADTPQEAVKRAAKAGQSK